MYFNENTNQNDELVQCPEKVWDYPEKSTCEWTVW